eukprot:SAG31_NODE_38509_length_295_cov_1.326531_1_plen_38_part_01
MFRLPAAAAAAAVPVAWRELLMRKNLSRWMAGAHALAH